MLLVLDWEKFSILHYFIMANYLNKISNVDGLRQGEFFYPLLYARIVNKFESNIFMHSKTRTMGMGYNKTLTKDLKRSLQST